MTEPVNLATKLALFQDHWRPHIIGTMNNLEVMVVKADGEFHWHQHVETDDFFLVLKGVLEIGLRENMGGRTVERTVVLQPGELFVVPRGVEHRPAARHGQVELLLIEPKGTPNTGNPATAVHKLTI